MAHPLVAESMQRDRARIAKRLANARRRTAYTKAEQDALDEQIRRLEVEMAAANRLVIER